MHAHAPRRSLCAAIVRVALAILSAAPALHAIEAQAQSPTTTMVGHYYQSILRRSSDAGGQAFWEGEAGRVSNLGANINETWYAMAMSFYASPEYLAFNSSDAAYLTDLYNTFFNRVPDAGGLAFWTSQVTSGVPREVVLASFMFSPEFASFTQGLFGNTAARAEVNVVVDFYRGLLSRLPDTGGFNFWVQQFRTAQCQSAGAVSAQVNSISSQFVSSGEYASRNRTNAQYVGDLYNAFLRRGGDLAGVQFWINRLNTNAETRDQVRQEFLASPEFSARVAAVVAQGCGGAPIRIISVSSTSPVALTPLQTVVAGINSNAPLTATFSNAVGFSASGPPMRSLADGTIVLGVPLYLDEITQKFGSGSVQLTITQNGISSAPVSLAIQDLPSVASYGVTPGTISHAFLALHAMAVTSQINQLGMYDIASSGTASTSTSENHLFALQSSVIQARNDIDRVTLNNAVSIDQGTLNDGTVARFDRNALDRMDRLFGVFLTKAFSDPQAIKRGEPKALGLTMAQILDQISHAYKAVPAQMGALDSIWAAQKGCAASAGSMGCVTDGAGAVGAGLSAGSSMFDEYASRALADKGEILSERLGLLGAAFSTWSLAGQLYRSESLSEGGSPADVDTLNVYDKLIGDLDAISKSAKILAGGANAPPFFTSAANVFGATAPLVSFVALAYSDYKANVDKEYDRATLELELGNYRLQRARARGHAAITNVQGLAAAPTGIEICRFGPLQNLCLYGLTDGNGDYEVQVPLGMPGTDYSQLSLGAYDPVTGDGIASQTVDLRGLNTSAPLSIPTIAGSCIDTDATNPDGDDPDCD